MHEFMRWVGAGQNNHGTVEKALGFIRRLLSFFGDENRKQVKDILRHLRDNEVELPAGGVLTPERFLQLGLALGGGGGFESLHYLLENAFDARGDLSYSFLREV